MLTEINHPIQPLGNRSCRQSKVRSRPSTVHLVSFPSKLWQGLGPALGLIFLFACQPSLPDDVELVYHDVPDKVDFNFHIQPILSDRCYKCHGPDDNAREADFRLDLEERAFAKLKKSGGYAFVKGNISKSVAWKRITSNDPEFHMPPPESNLSLSAKEKALITKWIKQGAEWKEHWAFNPPVKSNIPTNFPQHWKVNNPIDNFIQAKLEEQSLHPSEEAGKERLIRRVTMDLTGLPPTIQEIENFLSDQSPNAYEKVVDRLLTTDAHAERMAMEWLDVARYADSQGMHADRERLSWPWRDWVIKAFQENMPYDEFITWQLAGDLLPEATRDQKLATAFLRNHPMTAEGGVIDEEFRQKYVQDRTNTTATAFMGLTLECATCHDHKFDPISQKEYYQVSAFFNNLKEIGMVAEGGGASGPVLLLPDEEAENKLKVLNDKIDQTVEKMQLSKSQVIETKEFIEALQNERIKPPVADAFHPFESLRPEKIEGEPEILRALRNNPIKYIVDHSHSSVASGEPEVVKGRIGSALRTRDHYDMIFLKDVISSELNQPFSVGSWIKTEKIGENQTIIGNAGDLQNAWRGWELFLDKQNRLSFIMISYWPHNYLQITTESPVSSGEWHHVSVTYNGSGKADGVQLYVDGKITKHIINHDNLYRSAVNKQIVIKGWRHRPLIVGRSGRSFTGDMGAFTGSIDHVKLFKRCLTYLEVAASFEEATIADPTVADFTENDLVDHYLNRNHLDFQRLQNELQELQVEKLQLMEQVPEIMAMEEKPEMRKTYVLNRGQYNQPKEEVQAGTPQNVLAFPEDLPKNRVGLAKWLVDPGNPLTARVAVNRYWQMIFGKGIVATPHDFGTQGALPTHPDLLDWLAIEFTESNWDIRKLLKTMVLSATYKQSSFATQEYLEKDANNLFLARGASHRLPAEMIRDNALAASGLLNPKIGGESVKPYQPDGVWGFGSSGRYKEDTGDRLYRRSMYTFIRRTTPHPAMIAFDAPNRSVCTVKRENTNTPLQALVLLNDPQFVEAAKVLAGRMQKEGGADLERQTEYGFKLLCGRQPNTMEKELMKEQYQIALHKYQKYPKEADEILKVGEYEFEQNLDKIETAALAMVASTIMNFDEAYMKR